MCLLKWHSCVGVVDSTFGFIAVPVWCSVGVVVGSVGVHIVGGSAEVHIVVGSAGVFVVVSSAGVLLVISSAVLIVLIVVSSGTESELKIISI